MLDNVMPLRGTFFALLNEHTTHVVDGANASLRLVTNLGSHNELNGDLIEEVNTFESKGDEIKEQFIKLLHDSFTTPINRDQLYALILALDRILDTLQSLSNAINTYNIQDSTSESRTMSTFAAEATKLIQRAVGLLADRKAASQIREICLEVESIDERTSEAMRQAVTKIFQNEGDEAAAWHAMKMRRFYFSQEAVLSRCKRVARTIEEILLENA